MMFASGWILGQRRNLSGLAIYGVSDFVSYLSPVVQIMKGRRLIKVYLCLRSLLWTMLIDVRKPPALLFAHFALTGLGSFELPPHHVDDFYIPLDQCRSLLEKQPQCERMILVLYLLHRHGVLHVLA